MNFAGIAALQTSVAGWYVKIFFKTATYGRYIHFHLPTNVGPLPPFKFIQTYLFFGHANTICLVTWSLRSLQKPYPSHTQNLDFSRSYLSVKIINNLINNFCDILCLKRETDQESNDMIANIFNPRITKQDLAIFTSDSIEAK